MPPKPKKKIPTTADLVKKGVPYVLIPGIIWAGIYGPSVINKIKNYYDSKIVFPKKSLVSSVEDGDTINLKNGLRIRLLGINSPDRGEEDYQEAKDFLEKMILNQIVYLEYDRYQDDKFGRLLSWVWVNCETTPKFESPDYMHLSGNKSRPPLLKNPLGCQNGQLVNEELVKSGFAKPVNYEKRGPLKYQQRLESLPRI